MSRCDPYPLTPEQAPGKSVETFRAELAAWRARRDLLHSPPPYPRGTATTPAHNARAERSRLRLAAGTHTRADLDRLSGWREQLGRWYGNAHGCKGAGGGWVRNSTGAPIVQGWGAFYQLRRAHIWALALGLGAGEVKPRPRCECGCGIEPGRGGARARPYR